MNCGRGTVDEHAFGVGRSELASARGRASLVEQRRAVGRNPAEILIAAARLRMSATIGAITCFVRPPAIDVMDAEDVGQKQRVEFAALEDLRELDPVFERVIAVGAIARVGPQAGRLVPDAIHVESIEADLLWHRICCGSAVP
jgi:hypothetical protein